MIFNETLFEKKSDLERYHLNYNDEEMVGKKRTNFNEKPRAFIQI